jgi:hypothetical protein
MGEADDDDDDLDVNDIDVKSAEKVGGWLQKLSALVQE